MRGKVVYRPGRRLRLGITPAHAGKRRSPASRNFLKPGSPPRMRGKGIFSTLALRDIGITPAHAGKRGRVPVRGGEFQDHPRACGEKGDPPQGGTPATGSPPRMRGKGATPALALCHVRITPAHAGKSDRPAHHRNCRADHPRACGEKG